MSLEFLISTMHYSGHEPFIQMFQAVEKEALSYLIINQSPAGNLRNEEFAPGKRLVSFAERGLSKSRNRAIELAQGDICVVADNDLVYCANSVTEIERVYEQDPELDVAVFQIITPEGKAYKNYKKEPFCIKSPLQIMQVSSVEISFKRSSILKNNIRFNEQMGLGTNYTHGEEILFVLDCVKKGLKVKFFPIPMVVHPAESSGKSFSKGNILASGITFAKLFPLLFPLVDFYFALKWLPRYRQSFSFWFVLSHFVKGNLLALSRKV